MGQSNGHICGATIINCTRRDTRRVDMIFSIGYDNDIRKARNIIQSLLDGDEGILADSTAQIAVAESMK